MQKLIKLVLDRPGTFIVVIALLTVIMAMFLPRLEFDASIEAMIPADDPVLAELGDITDEFGSQELFIVALKSDDIFQPATLRKIADLERDITALPGVRSVQSPLNMEVVESSFFGLEIRPITDTVPQTEAEIATYRASISDSPLGERLVTSDGQGAMLMLDLDPGLEDENYVIAQVEAVANSYQSPEEIYVVGDAYVFQFTEKAMVQDLVTLVPFVVIVIIAILLFTFRSFIGVAIPLITVLSSLIWTMGVMSLLNIPVSMISMVLPVILVTLGIASSIHILNKYQELLGTGISKRKALEQTYQDITAPVMMAAFTTAAGFAALITAFVQPMREFGVLTAFGVLAAMLLSFTLVPAILILVRPFAPANKGEVKDRKSTENNLIDRFLVWVANFTIKRSKGAIIIIVVLLVVVGAGALRIGLESNIVNYFAEDTPVKKGTGVVEDLFGGSMQLSIVFDTGAPDGIKDPEVLQEMIAVQEYLNSYDTINQPTSIADLLRLLNQALWDGDPEYYAIPDTPEAVAQQLLLFTMQGGSELDALVSYDYQRALVTAQMKTLDAEAMSTVITEIEEYVADRYGSHTELDVSVTGTPKVMLRLMDRYVQTQVASILSSSITVGIIVIVLMKSVILGLLCMVPLLFTVVVNFGVMGWLGIPLDAITTIIASLAIGIGIDYAIHYVSRFRIEFAISQDPNQAILTTGRTAGRGIFFNAIALIAGFLVLTFSQSFRAIAIFGYLIALTMVVSSLATLVIIPLLLKKHVQHKVERGTKMKGQMLTILICALVLLGGTQPAVATTLTGQEILEDMALSTLLSGSGTAELEMITENARGVQRSYSLRILRAQDDDGEQQLLEYLNPADVRGTKFLSLGETDGETQMWLYMPALGRERRIAAHMTGDSFMGTDFTYEEITMDFDYSDEYSANRLTDEEINGLSAYVLDLTADGDPIYERVKMWIWQDEMVPLVIEMYNPAATLAKSLLLDDFREVQGELVPHHIIMKDEIAGTRTLLNIIELNEEDIADDVFTLRYLRR